MTHSNRTQQGFTLIELLLSMAFLTFLLLFMVTATVQVMRGYNKGITLKQINQTARSGLEDMSRVLRTVDGANLNLNAISEHRFCVGGVSYVWNIQDNKLNRKNDGPRTPVTLARVQDPSASVCAAGAPAVPAAYSTDLLAGNVWVQDISVTPSLDGRLIKLSMTLSTADANAPYIDFLDSGNLTCGGATASRFCALTTFTTTVNTRNQGTQ